VNKKLVGFFSIILLLLITFFPTVISTENKNNIIKTDEKTIYIFVNENIYSQLEKHLEVFTQDLFNEDYNPVIYPISAFTPNEEVKNILIQGYENDNLIGCIFVGKTPYYMFELDDPSTGYELFPTDYYYRDIDGIWSDTDGNRMPDTHEGEIYTEIWCGRLWTQKDGGNNVSLLKNYFRKNHAFRTGHLTLPKRCLIYFGEDKTEGARSQSYNNLKILYDDIELISLPDKTVSPNDYLYYLTQGYEFLYLWAHSNPSHHVIGNGRVYNYDIESINPKVFFYLMSACSIGDFRNADYIVGSYLFSSEYSLTMLAETKVSSGGVHLELTEPLNEGKTIGYAFNNWVDSWWGGDWPFPRWIYGKTIFGDPSLIITKDYGPPTDNNRPEKPTISGETQGSIDTDYVYYVSSHDPDLDRIYFIIDWDDGNSHYESKQIQSGDILIKSYSWDKRGTYSIRVKAIDEKEAESEWSDPLTVTMPKMKLFNQIPRILIWLFEMFPFLQLYFSYFI